MCENYFLSLYLPLASEGCGKVMISVGTVPVPRHHGIGPSPPTSPSPGLHWTRKEWNLPPAPMHAMHGIETGDMGSWSSTEMIFLL